MNDLLLRFNMDNISDFFDECYEKAKKEEGTPEWLNGDFIRNAEKEFPFLGEYVEEVVSAIDAVLENSDLVLFARTLYHMLLVRKHHEEVFGGLKFPKAPVGENPLGYDMFSFYPLFAQILDSYRDLKKRGADEEIINITAKGVGGSLINGSSKRIGRLALNETYFLWLTTHKNGSLFKINRFSLEIRDNVNLNVYVFRNKKGDVKILMNGGMDIHKGGFVLGSAQAKDKDGAFATTYSETEEYYEGNAVDENTSKVQREITRLAKSEWDVLYAPKDTLISIHIPSAGAFDSELVEKSLKEGKEFLEKLYPEKSFKGLMCISWLLAPELTELLKPQSNILSFRNRFKRFPVLCEGLDVFSFVYKMAVSSIDDVDLDSLPENSSLERNLKDYYKSGNLVHETGGIIPF